jgi:hypothetical protein
MLKTDFAKAVVKNTFCAGYKYCAPCKDGDS